MNDRKVKELEALLRQEERNLTEYGRRRIGRLQEQSQQSGKNT